MGCAGTPMIGVVWASEVVTWQSGATTTTKSPPSTGRPRWVRSYGGYPTPSTVLGLSAVKPSSAAACNCSGLAATRACAVLAGSDWASLAGAGRGARRRRALL
ncbi:hypothetical protein GCM10010428_78000 [Actinosynnema pretiosum subsp. pretiosum]